MGSTVWITVAATIVCVALGWVSAILVARFSGNHRSARKFRNGDALAFVGGAFGIVLGLLLIFASQHFSDTREAARQEAVTASALYDSLNPFPEAQRTTMRHDVFCTVEALRTDDWEAGRLHDVTGSENTHAWLAHVQRDSEGLSQDSAAAGSMHYFVNDNYLALSKNRDLRLQLGLREIPTTIWIVIALSTIVFIFLLALHMGPVRRITAISIVAITIMLAAITGTLAGLDNPYSGTVGALTPISLDAASKAIQDSYPHEDFSPCPQLAVPIYDGVM